MQFVIQDNFTAQPFISSSGIPLNVAPKDFVKGTTVDATEQMNPARQMYWVTSDGYALDMSKASVALNPTASPATTTTTPIGPVMSLQVAQGFTATPFIFDPSQPLPPLQPKIFVTGQRIDAQQQYNSANQPFIVSGGYIVDMSKVQQINYPQYQSQIPPMGYYGPQRTVIVESPQSQEPDVAAKLAMPVETNSMFTVPNVIKVLIVALILYALYNTFIKNKIKTA